MNVLELERRKQKASGATSPSSDLNAGNYTKICRELYENIREKAQHQALLCRVQGGGKRIRVRGVQRSTEPVTVTEMKL